MSPVISTASGSCAATAFEELQPPLDGDEIQVNIRGPDKTHIGGLDSRFWILDLAIRNRPVAAGE